MIHLFHLDLDLVAVILIMDPRMVGVIHIMDTIIPITTGTVPGDIPTITREVIGADIMMDITPAIGMAIMAIHITLIHIIMTLTMAGEI